MMKDNQSRHMLSIYLENYADDHNVSRIPTQHNTTQHNKMIKPLHYVVQGSDIINDLK